MQIRLFIDESYGDDHYYVAGVLADDQALANLTRRLDALAEDLAEQYGLEAPVEFHAHEIMNGKKKWKPLNGNTAARVSILRRALLEVEASGVKICIEGVDVKRLRTRYRYPDPPYEISLRHLLERVDARCVQYGHMCVVEADMIDKKNDFIEAIAGYQRTNTPGYRPSQLGSIVSPISYIDSRSSRGIQAADMAVYVYRRHNEHVGGSAKSRRATARLAAIVARSTFHVRKWLP
ncbi:MAG: DUF3800 domain-containing protein [Corynebacterium variabile]